MRFFTTKPAWGLTSGPNSGNNYQMHWGLGSGWKIDRTKLFLLGGMIVLMLLIVVLPDVDLPFAAFHRGTAPLVVHASVTSAPAAIAGTVTLQSPAVRFLFHPARVLFATIHPGPNFLSILLRTLRL